MVDRIERPRSRLCVLLLGVGFFAVFVILLGVGGAAPDVLYVENSATDHSNLEYLPSGANFLAQKFEYSREHQLFWVELRLGTGNGLLVGDSWPQSIDVDVSVTLHSWELEEENAEHVASYTINATQNCPDESEPWCDYFFLFKHDFVDHDQYSLSIKFPDPEEYLATVTEGVDHADNLYNVQSRVTSINPEFTRFVVAFKYIWLIATLVIMYCPCGIGYMSALSRHRRDTGLKRTFYQRWTGVLLWALVWFDEPFVAATVYSDVPKLFSAVFILSASIFVFLILLFWLCFLADVPSQYHGNRNVKRGICYWVPKVVLTLAIGVTVLSGYMHYRFEETISSEYDGVGDNKKAAEALAVLLGLMLSVYLLWTVILGLRSCGGLRKVSPSHILLYAISMLASLIAVIGVFVAAYYPYSTSGAAFVVVHGLLNLYVWTLAVSFSPVRSLRSRSDALGMGEKPVSLGGASAAVTGTADTPEDDLTAWEDPADADFKAVEL